MLKNLNKIKEEIFRRRFLKANAGDRGQTEEIFRRRIFKANAGEGVSAKVTLPPHWEKEISDMTRAGNRWIVENCHLPLSKYDYPL